MAMIPRWLLAVALAVGGLGACGGADFGIKAGPAPAPVFAGSGRWVKIDLTREDGYTGDVVVTVSDPSFRVSADIVTFTGDSASEPLSITVDPDTAPGELEITVVASSGGDSTTTTLVLNVLEAQPSSQELIAAALAAGQIDLGTSLLYRSQAQVGDLALPEPYRGSGSDEDLGLAFDIRAATPQLSPDAVAALRPYTVRPAAADSVYALASARKAPPDQLAAPSGGRPMIAPEDCAGGNAWRSKRSAQIPIRVWIECSGADSVEANAMARTLGLFEKLWGPETMVFSVPLNDAGGPDDGGDDAIDVYLVQGAISRGNSNPDNYTYTNPDIYTLMNLGAAAVARPTPSSPPGLPPAKNGFGNDVDSGYIFMPRTGVQGEDMRSTLTHELAHVLQFSHNTLEAFANSNDGRYWFFEASATWASVHFDRELEWPARVAANTHRRRFGRHVKGGVALNAGRPELNTYAAYIWALFIDQEVGPALIGTIWNSLDAATSPGHGDDLMNARFSFADKFQTFALRNLNQAFLPGDPLPANERYHELDKEFPDGDPTPVQQVVTLEAGQNYVQDLVLPPLSTNYVLLDVAGNDITKVELLFFGDLTRVDIDALILPDDAWLGEPLKFTGENRVVFCFDKGLSTQTLRGVFKGMQLVISNHAHAKEAHVAGQLRIVASNSACGVWRGTTRSSLTSANITGNSVETIDATAVLEYDADNSGGVLAYKLQSGAYTYRHDFTSVDRTPPCRSFTDSAGPMTPAMLIDSTPGSTFSNLILYPGMPQTYTGGGQTWVTETTTTSCNNSLGMDETSSALAFIQWWSTPGAGPFEVDPTGTSISGSANVQDPATGSTITYTWNFSKVDE